MVSPSVSEALVASALFGWSPVVVCLFRVLGRRAGTLAAVVAGYLVLPKSAIRPPGGLHFLYFEKQAAIGLSLAVAMLVWDRRALLRFRPKPWDLPILAFTAWTALIVFAGQFVEYDVGDRIAQARLWWFFPYLAGRFYFGETEGSRQIAAWVVSASLLLAPAVAYEALAGPSRALLSLVYGVPSDMTSRLGGWRPEVFLSSGIELSCWMALATVSALWLWLGGAWRPRWGPAWWPLLVLVPATAVTRGVYGYIDLAVGAVAVSLTLAFRTRAFLLILALVAPTYIGVRVSGAWDGRVLARPLEGTGRESTVLARLASEDAMIARVKAHNLAFGFGRPLGIAWGPAPADPTPAFGTDGLWVVFLWTTGLVGLGLQLLAQHFVPAGLALAWPRGRPSRAEVGAPEWGLALFVILAMLDGLHNMPSFAPLPLMVGALVGQAVLPRPRSSDEGRERSTERSDSGGGTGVWDTTVRRGGFVLRPAAVAAGLACLLYVFGHGRVAGFDTVKLVGGLGAALLFGAAGAAGSWASRRFPASRLVVFAALFGVFGVSFNLALHPTTLPWASADILQGMALCGLVVALWRRAFGDPPWADASLAVAPLVVHVLARPYLPMFPGSPYLVAGPGPAVGDALFPLCPWLTLAVLGGRALRESARVDLATAALLGLAAAIAAGPGGIPLEKFPMSLSYALLGSAAVAAAFALGRFQGFRGPAAWFLRELGARWAIYLYVHLAVARAIEQGGVTSPGPVWALLLVGGLAGAWLIAALTEPFARWFRTAPPWVLVLGPIVAAGTVPGLSPTAVTALAGVGGLLFAAYHRELAALVADAGGSPRAGDRDRAAGPATTPMGERDRPAHALARLAVLVALLVSPEVVSALGPKPPRPLEAPRPGPGPPDPGVVP